MANALNAIPGESYQQYEARLGSSTTVTPGQGFGTPTVNPTPPTPTMPPAVKTGIESAANSSGNGLGGVPTTSSSPTPIDYTLHQGETVDQYNTRISAARGTSSTSTDSGTTSSAPNINDFLATVPPAPVAPNTTDETNTLNATPGGVNDIQNNITTLNSQLTNLSNDLQNQQANEASKPGVVATIINGRMKMLSAEDSKALNDLKAQISDQTRMLTQAQTAVKSIIDANATDYATAEKNYEFLYSKAITQYQDAVTQQDKQQANAKANAQVIINSFKGSSTGFNSITADTKAQWTQLELQAGLPSGTIEAAVKAELDVTKFVKGSDGSTYVTGTDANGLPYVAQVQGGTSTTSSDVGNWSKSQLNANTTKMSQSLNAAKGTDGEVDDATYNQAKSDWINAGGTAASFESAFGSFKSKNNK